MKTFFLLVGLLGGSSVESQLVIKVVDAEGRPLSAEVQYEVISGPGVGTKRILDRTDSKGELTTSLPDCDGKLVDDRLGDAKIYDPFPQ